MANILAAIGDSIFVALIEDQLLSQGHRVLLPVDGRDPAAIAAEDDIDLLILDVTPSKSAGLQPLLAVREGAETSSLPVVVLSEVDESEARVAALRAGADDFLASPCNLEELALRVDRLLGRGRVAEISLSGSLGGDQLGDVLQYLRQTRKSGSVLVRGEGSSGRMELERGGIAAVRFEHYEGRSAALAMLGLTEGRFRFVARVGPFPAVANALEPEGVLIRAAWLEDELEMRRKHLPATGEPLAASGVAPQPPADFDDLPIVDLTQRIGRQPGVRIYDLLSDPKSSPQEVRLAIAWLVEHGFVQRAGAGDVARHLTTGEITVRASVEVAVEDLAQAARRSGFTLPVIPYLILAEAGLWGGLRDLFSKFTEGHDELAQLARRLQERASGTATFDTPDGKLSLHCQRLGESSYEKIEAILPICAGLVVWLDQAADADALRRIVDEVRSSSRCQTALLVATTPGAKILAAAASRSAKQWRFIPTAPQSLVGMLRLLNAAPDTTASAGAGGR